MSKQEDEFAQGQWLSICEHCEYWGYGKPWITTVKHAWHWLWCKGR